MSRHFDVIVIGMGLSGLMAAKTAVEAGMKVLLVGKGMGSLCLFSNSIDLLGSLPGKITEGLSQWVKNHPLHPYSKVGPKRIEEALFSFISLFPPPYSFQTTDDGNFLIPTGAGMLHPTYLLPSTMIGGASFKGGDGLIVGFKGFKDFYAHFVADQLKCRGVTLSLPELPYREVNAAALSRWMEKKSFLEFIGGEIKKRRDGEAKIGLPSILGIHGPMNVKRDLEEIIGAEVFEIPTLPPSVPGMRIFNRLKEWLIQKGVTFLLGHPISEVLLRGKRCEGVTVVNPPVFNSYSTDRTILATGRFMGGGLAADEEKVSESIFNLPVIQPKSKEGWFQNSFFSNSHPIHEAGISTDPSFRPLDENGRVILENVWIAGTILAHHRCIDEKSREGIEISTGYTAAKHALST